MDTMLSPKDLMNVLIKTGYKLNHVAVEIKKIFSDLTAAAMCSFIAGQLDCCDKHYSREEAKWALMACGYDNKNIRAALAKCYRMYAVSTLKDEMSYLYAESDTAYDFGKNDFTLEAWVKTDRGGVIISRKDPRGGGGFGGYVFRILEDGSLEFKTDDGNGRYMIVTKVTSITDNGWHHVLGVRQQGELTIYLDFVRLEHVVEYTKGTPLNVDSNNILTLAYAEQTLYPNGFHGQLRDVRIWNIAKTFQNLQDYQDYIPSQEDDQHIVGWWEFTSEDFRDTSCVKNDMNPYGEIEFKEVVAICKQVYTIVTPKDEMSYLYSGTDATYNFEENDFTIEAWVKTDQVGVIISREEIYEEIGCGGFEFRILEGGALMLETDDGVDEYRIVTHATPVMDNSWHHILGVRQQGELHIYLDFNKVGHIVESAKPAPMNAKINDLFAMVYTEQRAWPEYPQGQLREVRVWNKAKIFRGLQDYQDYIPSEEEYQRIAGWWDFISKDLRIPHG